MTVGKFPLKERRTEKIRKDKHCQHNIIAKLSIIRRKILIRHVKVSKCAIKFYFLVCWVFVTTKQNFIQVVILHINHIQPPWHFHLFIISSILYPHEKYEKLKNYALCIIGNDLIDHVI